MNEPVPPEDEPCSDIDEPKCVVCCDSGIDFTLQGQAYRCACTPGPKILSGSAAMTSPTEAKSLLEQLDAAWPARGKECGKECEQVWIYNDGSPGYCYKPSGHSDDEHETDNAVWPREPDDDCEPARTEGPA